ncbi:hypothetical protein GCM10027059_19330 [Myceligenerans halotolerans]
MDRKILRIRISVAMSVSALVLTAAAWGPGLDGPGGDRSDGLRVLVGPGDGADTKSVRAAVRAWSRDSGRGASVGVAADMPRQLSQEFANGSPPDVFALGADELAAYATRGFLRPYGDDLPRAEHVHPALVEAFTVDGALVCAPKDPATVHDGVTPSEEAQPGAPPFTECWAVAAESADHEAAVDLVRHLSEFSLQSVG